jgi:hypothetical protein
MCAAGIPRFYTKIIMMGLQMIQGHGREYRHGPHYLKDLSSSRSVWVATGYVDAGVVGMQKVCCDIR